MPEISVYMSEDDLIQTVAELFKDDCEIVPNLPFDRPEPDIIYSVDSFREWRVNRGASHLFVISNEWTVAPFEWHKIEKNGEPKFYIMQKAGGPTLDILLPLPFKIASGKTVLPSGFVGYHSTFWNPLTTQNEKPPEALKSMYKRIVKKLRAEADYIQGQQRKFLIAKGAKARLEEGWILGPPFNTTDF